MIKGFDLGSDVFEAVATGAGTPSSIPLLRDVWLSEGLVLLRFLVRELSDRVEELSAAYEVLARAQARDHEAVRDLLASPWFGVWVVRCATRLRAGRGLTATLRGDLSYLPALAAVAALRTGLDADLHCRTRGNRLILPGVGAVRLADGEPAATLRVRDGGVEVRLAHRQVALPADPAQDDGAGWLALRRLRSHRRGWRLDVQLDDLDPHRTCYGRPLSKRLGAPRVRQWQHLLDSAWDLLVRHNPGRAAEVATGLAAMVPLSARSGAPGFSVTSEDAFGAFALTQPRGPATFAATLVHEFQHSKLGALWRAVPLFDRAGKETYYSPWRDDPRPLGGLMQGAFAFLSVADFWRALRTEPTVDERAEHEFARLREEVLLALETLDTCGRLTPDGWRIVAAMRASLDRLMAERVPRSVVARAREIVREKRAAWDARQADLRR